MLVIFDSGDFSASTTVTVGRNEGVSLCQGKINIAKKLVFQLNFLTSIEFGLDTASKGTDIDFNFFRDDYDRLLRCEFTSSCTVISLLLLVISKTLSHVQFSLLLFSTLSICYRNDVPQEVVD